MRSNAPQQQQGGEQSGQEEEQEEVMEEVMEESDLRGQRSANQKAPHLTEPKHSEYRTGNSFTFQNKRQEMCLSFSL